MIFWTPKSHESALCIPLISKRIHWMKPLEQQHWAWVGKITIMLLWRPEFASSFKHYWCVKTESRFCHACIVLCLFPSTEKLAYFKIWVTLPSKYVVFLTFTTRDILDRKSHFKRAHFMRDFTPLPHRGSGTPGHIVIIIVNSEISSMSPNKKTKQTQAMKMHCC